VWDAAVVRDLERDRAGVNGLGGEREVELVSPTFTVEAASAFVAGCFFGPRSRPLASAPRRGANTRVRAAGWLAPCGCLLMQGESCSV
jgi:hypothetical protein